MQIASISVNNAQERMLLEFEGEFETLDMELGELTVCDKNATMKCGNVYIRGEVEDLSHPRFVFGRDSPDYLSLQYVIRRRILFSEEPNYYEQ